MENWKTTIGGVLVALGIAGANVAAVPEEYRWLFAVAGALGAVFLGGTAKDYNTHSTAPEVKKATEQKIDSREWGQS